MTKIKIRKVGNSLGAIIPSEVLERLHVGEGDDVFLVEGPDGLTLTPYDPAFERGMEVFEQGRRKYRNALRRLSK